MKTLEKTIKQVGTSVLPMAKILVQASPAAESDLEFILSGGDSTTLSIAKCGIVPQKNIVAIARQARKNWKLLREFPAIQGSLPSTICAQARRSLQVA